MGNCQGGIVRGKNLIQTAFEQLYSYTVAQQAELIKMLVFKALSLVQVIIRR